MDTLLTVKEVAAMLRVSAQTLYKMLEQGGIPAVKVGSQWRFERDKVRAWLQAQGASAGGEQKAGVDRADNPINQT